MGIPRNAAYRESAAYDFLYRLRAVDETARTTFSSIHRVPLHGISHPTILLYLNIYKCTYLTTYRYTTMTTIFTTITALLLLTALNGSYVFLCSRTRADLV